MLVECYLTIFTEQFNCISDLIDYARFCDLVHHSAYRDRNVKRINSVDHWEYPAGWFEQESGLNNSKVLMPVNTNDSSYSIIN